MKGDRAGWPISRCCFVKLAAGNVAQLQDLFLDRFIAGFTVGAIKRRAHRLRVR